MSTVRAPVQGNLVNTLFMLISRLPPEGLVLLEALVKAMLYSRDPMIALRIAALSLASKAGVHEVFDAITKMVRLPARAGRSPAISAADAKRLRELARDHTA